MFGFVAAMMAVMLFPALAQAQDRGIWTLDTTAIRLDVLPDAALERLETVNVREADLRDVFRGIAHQYGLNLIVDSRIDRRVTVRLAGLPVIEAIAFLARENGLVLSQEGYILRVDVPPEPAPPPPPVPEPPHVMVRGDSLTVDLHGEELETVMRLIAQESGRDIVVRQGVRGPLRGLLTDVPFVLGLRTLLQNNGFALREKDGIFHVDRAGFGGAEDAGAGRAFWVQVDDSLVSFDVVDARIADVLREMATQLEVNLVTYAVPEGSITARVAGLPLDDCLELLFKGTNITYRRSGNVYVIGDKQTHGIAATRLLRLGHIRADAVLELLPKTLREHATIQVVREHNGLMVTGTNDVIAEVETFVREVDHPTPQILIEALVVDFAATDFFELGLRFGRNKALATKSASGTYLFETTGSTDPEEVRTKGFRHSGDGRTANTYLDALSSLAGVFGIQNIGHLPEDFFFQLHALSQEGKANIRSRPQVSTLNGHTASITIGTTQYYILDTDTPYQQPGQFYLQSTERFEKIEANVKLEITPWVSASGEVTTEIRPEFSAPVGRFDPEVPPTINSRVLDSTVRLRDGETIILGGLIQDVDKVVYHKVPLLGSIPLLGRLFSGRSSEREKSELVIFITPHVFYGDERDDAKWRALRDRMDLSADASGVSAGYTILK